MRSWLGAALFWCAVAIAALTVGLLIAGRGGLLDAAVATLVGVGVAGVARVLTARRPENRVGYALATIALLFVTAIACDSYSGHADASDPRAALTFAVCLGQQIWNLWLLSAVGIALPLLFPDGELPSPRWRVVAWAGVVGTAIGSLVLLVDPGIIESNSDRRDRRARRRRGPNALQRRCRERRTHPLHRRVHFILGSRRCFRE